MQTVGQQINGRNWFHVFVRDGIVEARGKFTAKMLCQIDGTFVTAVAVKTAIQADIVCFGVTAHTPSSFAHQHGPGPVGVGGLLLFQRGRGGPQPIFVGVVQTFLGVGFTEDRGEDVFEFGFGGGLGGGGGRGGGGLFFGTSFFGGQRRHVKLAKLKRIARCKLGDCGL